MKVELIDVSDTRKTLKVEVPATRVDSEIDRVTREYARSARLPGFRPGKAPAKVIRQRFKQQILHEVAHDLIPRIVGDALNERGVEPIDTPAVRDVTLEEGQPLTFSAAVETVPPVDPGDLASLTLRRSAIAVTEDDVDKAVSRLRERAARFEPVEDREAQHGDTVVVDLERRRRAEPAGAEAAENTPESHQDVGIEIGSAANPPGFDEALMGLRPGDRKTFVVSFPADHEVADLAGADVEYAVTVKALRRRVLPALDDEFAKDLGEFGSLAELRDRVRQDLVRHAEDDRARQLRQEMLRQLAARVTFDPPEVLVAREVDRRVEEFVRQLIAQGIDPMRTEIDWQAFREEQGEPARQTVRSVLVLDEIARREQIRVEPAEVGAEVDRLARGAGRERALVARELEREGGLARLQAGMRRERTIDFVISRATIVDA
jgi:trigger factor